MNEKLITKYDKSCFKLVKRLILFEVKRKRFRQNKYYIFGKMYDVYLAVYFISCLAILPVGLFLGNLSFGIIALLLAIFFLGGLVKFSKRNSIYVKAQLYDSVFQNRKHPRIYQGVKDLLKNHFKEDFNHRALSIPFHLVSQAMGLFFFSFNVMHPSIVAVIWIPYLLNEFFIEYIDRYVLYVFDFDPPDKREKKDKESLTDLMRRVIEGFLRQPLRVPSMGNYSSKKNNSPSIF